MQVKIFIATSLDGYIADENGEIDWLTSFPPPSNGDGGFSKLMESVDAVLMGRKTYQKVLTFGIDWPYSKKVFVWTNTLEQVPVDLEKKVELVRGDVKAVIGFMRQQQISNLYIDGGRTIQSFLREKCIHEIILTQVPILLGGGFPLFVNSPKLRLRHLATQTFDNGMVQTQYKVDTELN